METLEQKIELTVDQQKVIDHKKGNMLVSASAGSGKTKTLIAKIVDILKSQSANVKDLLIVTFTRSASEEIKQRLQEAIQESKDPKIQEQIDDLSLSDILTFDAFCKKVVQEFGYEVGVESGFEVADQVWTNFIKNSALDNLISRHKKAFDQDFALAVKVFYENRNENAFKSELFRLYDFVTSHNGFDYYQTQLSFVYDDLKNSVALPFLNAQLLAYRDNFDRALANLELSSQMAKCDKLAQNIQQKRAMIAPFGNDFFENLKYYCNSYSTIRVVTKSKNDSADFEEIQQELKKESAVFAKALKTLFDPFKDKTFEELAFDSQNDKKLLETMLSLAKEFDVEYKKLKAGFQVLDFVDLEEYAFKILQNQKIAEALQNKYKYICIDEYQDTSDLQNQIIDKITSGDNLLMVGDVKQSIYRYRNAEPQIFINKYNFFGDDAQNKLIELNQNFRSEKKVLGFVNFVFDNAMRKSIDGIDYKQNAQLKFGEKIKSFDNQIDVILLQKVQKEQQEQPFGYYSVKNSPLFVEETSRIQNEAFVLAGEIAKATKKLHYDAKKKKFLETKYGDIAVLCRDNKDVILQVRTILNQLGIPTNCTFDDDLSKSVGIQLILAVLKVIENMQNDIPLLTVMTSVVGKFDFDDVVEIREFSTQKGAKQNSFLFDAINLYQQNNQNQLSNKIGAFKQKIESYRVASQSKDICELVLYIVQREKLDLYFWLNGFGKEFDEHLRLFLSNFSSIKDYFLAEFVAYIDNFAGELKVKNQISDGEDAVTISTIHASKGLEYPVVFLLQAGKTFSGMSKRGKVLYDNALGFAVKSTDVQERSQYDGIVYCAFKAKIDAEQKKDEKRLLYVALTRAKNNLTIIGTQDVDDFLSLKTDFDVNRAKTYLDWIFGSLDDYDLESFKSNGQLEKQIDDFKINFVAVNPQDIAKPQITENVDHTNKVVSKDFQEIVDAHFEHCNLAKKSTVTQIMEQEEHYNISNFSAYKTDSAGDEDFLAIGTAYHKVMQYIDFFDKESIEEQLKKMLSNGTISQTEFALLDIQKIEMASNLVSTLCQKTDKILREQQFLCHFPANLLIKTTENQSILVQGVADILIVKQNEIILIDYKTSRLKSEDYAKKYSTQLDIYSRAIADFYGLPVTKKYIYSFHLDKLILI